MPGVSIHVVDVVRGQPAVGLEAELQSLPAGAAPVTIGRGVVGADGQVDHPMVRGTGITLGEHQVLLRAGTYYRAAELLPAGRPAFLEVAAFRFTVGDLKEHYHLPFKLSPWGLSVWRGR